MLHKCSDENDDEGDEMDELSKVTDEQSAPASGTSEMTLFINCRRVIGSHSSIKSKTTVEK